MKNEMRTVKDLVERLSTLDQNATVTFARYEGGAYTTQAFWRIQSIQEKTSYDTLDFVNIILQS